MNAMKKADQDLLALSLKASIKEYLYCNSPLRNDFQVRPVDEGEIKGFKGVKYARVVNENNTKSDEIKNRNVFVPFFEISCLHQDFEKFSDKFEGFNKVICKDMLRQEKMVFKKLKRYFTKDRKGVLLIRTDVQVSCCNEKNVMGFSVFEQIGVVVLNK